MDSARTCVSHPFHICSFRPSPLQNCFGIFATIFLPGVSWKSFSMTLGRRILPLRNSAFLRAFIMEQFWRPDGICAFSASSISIKIFHEACRKVATASGVPRRSRAAASMTGTPRVAARDNYPKRTFVLLCMKDGVRISGSERRCEMSPHGAMSGPNAMWHVIN